MPKQTSTYLFIIFKSTFKYKLILNYITFLHVTCEGFRSVKFYSKQKFPLRVVTDVEDRLEIRKTG